MMTYRPPAHNRISNVSPERPKTPRSFLFVPASRPDRFFKAQQSGADTIVLDLEDTLSPEQKAPARQAIIAFDKQTATRFWVRVNNDRHLSDDLEALGNCQHLAGIILPKVISPTPIGDIFVALNIPVIATIESPEALFHLATIAEHPAVLALSFGLLDLGNALNASPDSQGANTLFNHIRSQLVIYSSAYGLARPIDTIFTHFHDDERLRAIATHSQQMGFGGQLAIHPKQIPIINASYSPSDDERLLAQKIATHYQATGLSLIHI